jgi:hypothetical protein
MMALSRNWTSVLDSALSVALSKDRETFGLGCHLKQPYEFLASILQRVHWLGLEPGKCVVEAVVPPTPPESFPSRHL